jgi:hypothetical protein
MPGTKLATSSSTPNSCALLGIAAAAALLLLLLLLLLLYPLNSISPGASHQEPHKDPTEHGMILGSCISGSAG